MTLARILDMFRGHRLDRELDAELRHHVEALEAQYRARGLSGEDARVAAVRDMGGLIQAKEAHRDQRRVAIVETTWRNVRFAARSLARTPGVTAAIIFTLAIAIGGNTAIFTIVNGVLIRPLPYFEADRLVSVGHRSQGSDEDIPSAPYLYFTYRDQTRALQSVGLWRTGPSTITGLDRPEQVQTLVVTREILPTLGVAPLVGREFSASDDAPGGAQTAILTYGYWQRRFGGDASIVGRRLVIDGTASEVIAVMPRSFKFLDRPIDIVVPFQLDRSQVTLGRYVFQSVARLKPGVTLPEATADLSRLVPLAIEAFPPPAGYTRAQFARRPMTPRLRPLKDEVVGAIGPTLWVVMGALGLVLLIACANVANLLLVRTDGRQQELAVRAALGASWQRIAVELLVESVVLSLASGVAALVTAYGALQIVKALGPASLPRLDEIALDGRALVFTSAIALASGLAFGLLPVIKYANARLGTALAAGARTAGDTRDRRRVRAALVVVQVAMALVLLVCSGLMLRTFEALTRVQPGFTNPEEIQLVHVNASMPEAEQTTRTQQAIVDRIAAIPGVRSVAFADLAPLGPNNSGSDTVLSVEGKIIAEGQPRPLRRFEFISPGYFQTLGTPVVAGRDLSWEDLYGRRTVALVSEKLARDEWGSAMQALRQRVRASPADPWREIVGVVGDLRDNGLGAPPPPVVYFPALMDRFWGIPTVSFGPATFAIRSPRAGSERFLGEVEQAVWAVSRNLPIAQVRTLADVHRGALARTSFALTMLLLAGAMGLLLGFIGVYGVIAYGVTQRTREIGVRLALGAQVRELEAMFVRDGLALAGAGVAAGVVAAFALTRAMSSLLFGVSATDPTTYVAVAALVLAVAAAAAYLPARRAATRTPLDALRQPI
jgi:predicted permease